MLITIKRKNNNGNTKLNLTGVAVPHITGNKIIETTTTKHTHKEEYIDHRIETPRTNLDYVMVVNADSTR